MDDQEKKGGAREKANDCGIRETGSARAYCRITRAAGSEAGMFQPPQLTTRVLPPLGHVGRMPQQHVLPGPPGHERETLAAGNAATARIWSVATTCPPAGDEETACS